MSRSPQWYRGFLSAIAPLVASAALPTTASAQHRPPRLAVEYSTVPARLLEGWSSIPPRDQDMVDVPRAALVDSLPRAQRGCGGRWQPGLRLAGAVLGMAVIGKWAVDRSESVGTLLLSAILAPGGGMVVGGIAGDLTGEYIDCRRARRRGPTLPRDG